MIKRTIEISTDGTHLALKHRQMIVTRDGKPVGQVPIEDIGLLIVDTKRATYTHGTLVALLQGGAVVVLCGDDHMPAAYLTALEGHYIQAERMKAQIEASQPVRKRLWQRIIQAKIRNQAEVAGGEAREHLRRLADRVRSGDPDNVESQAARSYWGVWLDPDLVGFRRRRDGEPPNNLLNYGYMALRGAVARALVGAGLHPSLGLRHCNRYNAFALADDVMEPFRPLVDREARELYREGCREIDKEAKIRLLNVLTHTCRDDDKGMGPLLVALERMSVSLARCLAGEEKSPAIPDIFFP